MTAIGRAYPMGAGSAIYGGRTRALDWPAWRTAMAANTWAAISSNDILDIDPEGDPLINDLYPERARWALTGGLVDAANQWGGGALNDTLRRYAFCNGGHSGYEGNEWYEIDLTQDAPTWQRRGYPSGSIQRPCANVYANGAHPSLKTDGRPHQVHTYSLLSYLPSGDLVLAPGGAPWQGGFTQRGYVFDRQADDWDTARMLQEPSGYGGAGCSCYDPIRNCIWVFGGDKVISYDAMTLARTDHFNANGNLIGYYGTMVHDTTRDLMVVFLGSAGQGPFAGAYVVYFNPADPTAFTVAPQDNTTRWGVKGVGYHAASDRYITWTGTGNNLTVITPPATSPGTNTWVSSTLTCSGTVPPAPQFEMYGKFQVSNSLNCVLALTATGLPLYALALG
jgi:hypothetical protein